MIEPRFQGSQAHKNRSYHPFFLKVVFFYLFPSVTFVHASNFRLCRIFFPFLPITFTFRLSFFMPIPRRASVTRPFRPRPPRSPFQMLVGNAFFACSQEDHSPPFPSSWAPPPPRLFLFLEILSLFLMPAYPPGFSEDHRYNLSFRTQSMKQTRRSLALLNSFKKDFGSRTHGRSSLSLLPPLPGS